VGTVSSTRGFRRQKHPHPFRSPERARKR
jgi:hypothetical protein